jgi:hypothetical protein
LGSRADWFRNGAKVVEYATYEKAEAEARRLTNNLNRHQAVNFHYRHTAPELRIEAHGSAARCLSGALRPSLEKLAKVQHRRANVFQSALA